MQVAQRNLEIAYHDTGYYDRRVAQLQERLRQAPDDRDARWELGRAYAILGAHEEAVGEFEQLLAHSPKDVAAIIQLGLAEKNRGRPEAATEWFRRAVELEPDSTVVHFYLGEIYYNRGLNDEALVALERAVELNPDNANAHYLMAFVLGDLGRHQDARVASKRAIQLNPPLARAQTNLSLERYTAERKSQERRQRLAPEPQVVEGNELAHYNLGLAWNNLGVVQAHGAAADPAIQAFRTALQLQGTFSAARLNLALVLFQLRRFQLALEVYRQVLSSEPNSAAAWNGVGLVLVELKRFPDARNAFVRAVEGDPDHAGAHYNLSFTLSNLGDFDGALRATKRALELDPYYVSQKFALTIDLQYEKGTIGIAPEISADVAAETIGEDFNFDQRLLDNIFQELAPAAAAEPPAGKAADNPLALARDYVSKGLMDVAAAEAVRAVQRGASRAEAGVLLGDIFAKRGLHGEALERYREARSLEPGRADARLGEVKALFALGGSRAQEAGGLAEELLELTPDNVDALVAVAKGRAAGGDAAGALTALQQAQTHAPGRDARAGPLRPAGAAAARTRPARRQARRPGAGGVPAGAQVRPRPGRSAVPARRRAGAGAPLRRGRAGVGEGDPGRPGRTVRSGRARARPHRARPEAHLRVGRGLTHAHRRPAPRARHPRRLPAPRPEPEDGGVARHLRAAAQHGHDLVRGRRHHLRRDPVEPAPSGRAAAPDGQDHRSRSRARARHAAAPGRRPQARRDPRVARRAHPARARAPGALPDRRGRLRGHELGRGLLLVQRGRPDRAAHGRRGAHPHRGAADGGGAAHRRMVPHRGAHPPPRRRAHARATPGRE